MAKDKIILGKLDIDGKDLLKSSIEIKKQIDELVEKQGKLTEKGKESTAQFISNEVYLQKLGAAYSRQLTALGAYNNEGGKMVSTKKAIKEATAEQNKTESDYASNNERLIELKKQLNSESDNYEKRLAKINAKIVENNNWLKQNGTEYRNLRTSLEDYRQQVIESFDSINIFSTGIGGFINNAREAGGVGPLLLNAFKGITGGIKGMGVAMSANPVGAILQLLLPIIQAIFNAFKSFTPIVEKVEQVMAAVDAVFQSVKNSIIGLLTGATSIGDFFSNFASSAAEAADKAMELEAAQQKLNKEMQLQEIENEKAKNSIDALRAAYEDDTRSLEDRGKSLNLAIAAEKKNMDERKRMAEEAYRIANGKIANGANLTDEEMAQLKTRGLAYAKELQERKDISEEEIEALEKAELERERIYGESAALDRKRTADLRDFQKQKDDAQLAAQREAEQKAKELDDARKKRQDEALNRQKQQFALWAAEADAHGKSLEERLKYEDDYAKKSLAILQNELRLKKISLDEFKAAEIAIRKTQADNKLQIASDNAEAVLNLWQAEHKSKIDSDTKLTDDLVVEEKKRLADILAQNIKLEELKSGLTAAAVKDKHAKNEQLKSEEMNFLADILALESEYQAQGSAYDKALEEAKKAEKQKTLDDAAAQRAQQYEAQLAGDLTKYEEARILEQQRYDEEKIILDERKAAGLIDEAGHKAALAKINETHTANEKKIEEDLINFKLSQQSKLMDDMGTILGKESKAGKAFALAKTTIDTYQGAVAAYNSQVVAGDPTSVVRGAIAAAAVVAMGLKNVQKIAGVKDPKFEKGGLMSIGGNLHSNGGTKFVGSDGTRFEAERGELIGVMNRNAASHFMAFNNAFPSGGTAAPNYFASGGIVSREIAQKGMNMDELAFKIAEANRTLPPPVVAVEEILARSQSYVQVKEGANF